MTGTARVVADRTVIRNGRAYQVADPAPDDTWDFWAAFADATWEPELDDVLAEHLTPGSTFLDIGAWVGPVTLMAADLCSRVVAMEPDPVAFARLSAAVDAYRGPCRITIEHEALSDHDGTLQLGRKPNGWFGDSMTSVLYGVDAMTVPAVTLDTVLSRRAVRDVGLVKMDIEGGEETVLPAASATLRALGAPLLLSTHAMLVPDPGAYLATLDAALSGWDITVVSGTPSVLATLLAVPR